MNLATPFFTVYMLKILGLPLSTVIALSVLNQAVYFAFLGIWGNYSDRFSNKTVLTVNGTLLLLCILAWTFVKLPEQPVWSLLFLGVIHVFMGIANSGVALAGGNIGLKLAPKGRATTYLAAMTIVNSLAAGVAPILGGRFADFFARRELLWTLQWISPVRQISVHTLDFRHWDFFFALAFLIGLYSLHRLALVREMGEVKEDVIIHELLHELKTRSLQIFGSVTMLRLIFQFPFALAKSLRKPRPGHGAPKNAQEFQERPPKMARE